MRRSGDLGWVSWCGCRNPVKTFVSLKAYSDYSVSARSCVNVNVCPLCPMCVPAPPESFYRSRFKDTGGDGKFPIVILGTFPIRYVLRYVSYCISMYLECILSVS